MYVYVGIYMFGKRSTLFKGNVIKKSCLDWELSCVHLFSSKGRFPNTYAFHDFCQGTDLIQGLWDCIPHSAEEVGVCCFTKNSDI